MAFLGTLDWKTGSYVDGLPVTGGQTLVMDNKAINSTNALQSLIIESLFLSLGKMGS